MKVNLESADFRGAAPASLRADLPSLCPVQSNKTSENHSFDVPFAGGLLSWPPVCFISHDLLQSVCHLHFMSQTWEVLQDMKNRQHKHKVGLQRRLQALLRASSHAPAGCQEGCKATKSRSPAAPQPSAPRAGCLQGALWHGLHSLFVTGTQFREWFRIAASAQGCCSLWKHPTASAALCRDQSRSIPVDWGTKIWAVALSHKNKHS